MMRQKFFLGCLWLSLLLLSEGALAEPIRVGIPGLSAEFAPVWAARDKGLLKKYNLDTEVIAMQGGTQLVQAMIGGNLGEDIGVVDKGAQKVDGLNKVTAVSGRNNGGVVRRIEAENDARRARRRQPGERPRQRTRADLCGTAAAAHVHLGIEAAKLVASPGNFPFTAAMTHFARALGAARTGDPDAARRDVERITSLRDDLKAAKNNYWANEVEVMRLASVAWVALARKNGDEALTLMRQAADIEDKSEKNIVTPGRLLPARELLGDMLLELKRPADALNEYEASQHREPNRYRGLYGAAQAAAQSGNRDKARDYFSKLIELAGSGDLRLEMEKARRYLASN